MPPRHNPLSQRRSGILLHLTSLPGVHGSGDLGREAHDFIDFLAAAGVTWWQMLPTGPIGPGNSPYSSSSAFAGGLHLVSIDELVRAGLLSPREAHPPRFPEQRVDYPRMLAHRERALRRAFDCFQHDADHAARRELDRFVTREADWLRPFALFQALARHYPGRSWTRWPKTWRGGAGSEPFDRGRLGEKVAVEYDFELFAQFQFDGQWRALRAAAAQRGVMLLGDVPIFVDHASADVWDHQPLFQLDSAGKPKVVSGCPPDFFSATGQLWGHPLYDWPRHEQSGFTWWIRRFARMFELFDAARIDHFLGFHRYWAIPARHRTAQRGKYRFSPGNALFEAARDALKVLPLIAEDLGATTPEALALRDAFGFPGLRVLQNGFGDGARYDQPHNFPQRSAAYTSTHDTDTLAGWWSAARRERARGRDGRTTAQRVTRYFDCPPGKVVEAMVRGLFASPASLAILPLQDALGLGSAARMNTPAEAEGNWAWRVQRGAADARLAKRLHELSEIYERLQS